MSELSFVIQDNFEPELDLEPKELIASTKQNSLSCIYDAETNQLTFEWDADKNPEYNYLLTISTKEIIEKIIRWATSEDAAINTEAE